MPILESIYASEEKVQAMKEAATVEVVNLLNDAKKETEELIKQKQEELAIKVKAIQKEADQKINELDEVYKRKSADALSLLKEESLKRMDKAVALVMQKVGIV